MKLQLVSFNINGIRSYKEPVSAFLDHSDILCVQETKVNHHTGVVEFPNFHSFYSFPRLRKRVAYSGVATFVHQDSPFQVIRTMTDVEFLQDKTLDLEGRVLVSFHANSLIVVNVYFVNKSIKRYDFRHSFFVHLIEKVKELAKANPSSLIILCGDINIASAPIDHCDYSKAFGEGENSEFSQSKLFYMDDPVRMELNSMFLHGDLIDTFREMHPGSREAYTCWNTKVSARDGNYGTRIDLIIVVKNEAPFELKSADILSHIMGSDHCPVRGIFEITNPKEVGHSPQEPEDPEKLKKKRKLQTSLKDFLKSDNPQDTLADSDLQSPIDSAEDSNPKKRAKPTRITTFFETIPCDLSKEDSPPSREESKSDQPIHQWKDIFKKKTETPLCNGHREPCKLLKVNKKGPNQGRYFYMCARPVGNDLKVNQCNHFQWANPTKSKK
jgi:AP endonuclease 2